jgi:hypothetical protein
VEYAHIGKEPPDSSELETQFLLFEAILDLRLKDWWSATDAVADIVANANRQFDTSKDASSGD